MGGYLHALEGIYKLEQVNNDCCLLNHVSIPDHLNLCESLPSNVEPPICRADLPTVIFSYDHLEGVNRRHQLNATTETTLLTSLSYFKTVEELGGQVSLALQKVSLNFRVRCKLRLMIILKVMQFYAHPPGSLGCTAPAVGNKIMDMLC